MFHELGLFNLGSHICITLHTSRMKQKRERERREKAERERNLSDEDVEWEKLLYEVLNLYIGRHNLASEKKLSKKDKLNLESAHILLSAAIQRRCLH